MFKKGKNCSLFLTVPALLAMPCAILGPNTKIKGQSNGFTRGVDPITTDEGHRFLVSINDKQLKGESERSYLCKMWSGKGDYVDLSNSSRGLNKTSMSMCLYIQSYPQMSEMSCFNGMDGFLNRFLFMVLRPILFPTKVVKEHISQLVETGMQDFVDVNYKMFMDHQDGKEYSQTEEARKEYDELVDSYADLLGDKYKAVSDIDDEVKENDLLCSSQTNSCMTSSKKKTIQVIRLAAAIQVTSLYIQGCLNKTEIDGSTQISLQSLRKGGGDCTVIWLDKMRFFSQALNTVQKLRQ